MRLVFIPGLLCTKDVWGETNNLRSQYPCIDADVINYDTIVGMANAIEKQIDNSQKYAVIGISMGGAVALELATKKASWLKKLVLINTTADIVNPNTIIDREKAIELAKIASPLDIIALSNGRFFYQYSAEMQKIEQKMALATPASGFINQQHAIINRSSYLPKLKDITCSTLIISSINDKILPMQDSLDMHASIMNSQLISFNNCGHLPTLEKSKTTAKLIELFLEDD